jgi:alkylhydroperoxidase family enzyme
MSNIVQIDAASDQKELFATVKKATGRVPNLIATLAQSNACNYCLSAHSMLAKMKGYTEDAILDFQRDKSAQPKEQSMIIFHKVLANKGNFAQADIEDLRPTDSARATSWRSLPTWP